MNSPNGNGFLMKSEFANELDAIADWWADNIVDTSSGTLFGLIDGHAKKHSDGRRSLVYTCRMLWFFSEMIKDCDDEGDKQKYLEVAQIAFDSISSDFLDRVNGGFFWEIGGRGEPIDRSKKVYGHAFCIYGLVSFSAATGSSVAARLAEECFAILENRFRDRKFGGYVETLGEDWSPAADFRLSDCDGNYPKSMNAHLHVMEAFTSYHRFFDNETSKAALKDSFELFRSYILRDSSRLILFADLDWADQSGDERSLGHEIEFSWLACEAAETLGCEETIKWAQEEAVKIANHILHHGMTAEGRIFEGDSDSSVWWVQAEAIVGFINAYEVTGEVKFAEAALNVWKFIKNHHRSEHNGLWTWYDSGTVKGNEAKYLAGPWKGPYHDGRAMLEGVKRLEQLVKASDALSSVLS